MNWVAISLLVIVFLFTIHMVRHYATKGTPWYVYFFVFIGWFLAFSIVILIPFDVYASMGDNLSKDQEAVAYALWRVVYWTVFFLCWTILPVIQEYEMAGEFTFKSRLKTAVYRHVRIFILLGSLGIVLLIYLLIKNTLEVAHLPAFLMALSNCWGLFLIILLLGYGLVAIPRKLWYEGDCEKQLYFYQYRLSELDETLIDTKFKLDEQVKLIHAASYHLPSDSSLHPHLEEVIAKCPLDILEYHRSMKTQESNDTIRELGSVTESRLISLNKDLKETLLEFNRS